MAAMGDFGVGITRSQPRRFAPELRVEKITVGFGRSQGREILRRSFLKIHTSQHISSTCEVGN
jgi:hypothetical protein